MKEHLSKPCWLALAAAPCAAETALAQAPACNQSPTPDLLYFPAIASNKPAAVLPSGSATEQSRSFMAGFDLRFHIAGRIRHGAWCVSAMTR
jgi:hypothetical protein